MGYNTFPVLDSCQSNIIVVHLCTFFPEKYVDDFCLFFF